ncbi:MAG: hypothetical protein AVDCRST_MAG56-3936 [uncultured Cytophagales bacterium]|uniref:Uncharacterized protein n=1 Tax=uncultured Cytophagales bacterium TaxID=158755 RepID=A0A6J4JNY5_9SPHI|nr:MAG: hypothetical protein AVDCRST_MAG56-3936 [uncultured Cytophagales bacterium]
MVNRLTFGWPPFPTLGYSGGAGQQGRVRLIFSKFFAEDGKIHKFAHL